MKKIVKALLQTGLVGFLVFPVVAVMAQGGPPPPPSVHGETTNQLPEGGNAPVQSGLFLLLAMGAGYAIKKVLKERAAET